MGIQLADTMTRSPPIPSNNNTIKSLPPPFSTHYIREQPFNDHHQWAIPDRSASMLKCWSEVGPWDKV